MTRDGLDLTGERMATRATRAGVEGEGLIRQERPKSDASVRRLVLPRFVLDALTRRRVGDYCVWVPP